MATRDNSKFLETARRRARVARMRRSGTEYREIAARLKQDYGEERLPRGYDARYAYKDLKRELEKVRKETRETVKAVLEMELQRLDALLEAVWDDALAGKVSAVDRALSIMKRRAKLLGLDAPERHEHAGPDGGPMQTEKRTVNIDLSEFEETDDPIELMKLYEKRFGGAYLNGSH